MRVSYGDIFIVDLSQTVGCEQGGVRPCVVVQNDVGNVYSHITVVVPITSSLEKKYKGPTQLYLQASEENGLLRDGIVLCEQIRAVDKLRLHKKIGKLNRETMGMVKKCIKNNIPM